MNAIPPNFAKNGRHRRSLIEKERNEKRRKNKNVHPSISTVEFEFSVFFLLDNGDDRLFLAMDMDRETEDFYECDGRISRMNRCAR